MAQPIYKSLLGERYQELPAEIQELHDIKDEAFYRGECQVRQGKGLLALLTAKIMGFPPAMPHAQVSIHFKHEDGLEHWKRTFGSHVFYSRQWLQDGILFEKIGLITIAFDVQADAKSLALHIKRIFFAGIQVPAFLYPDIIAQETSQEGRFHFLVKANMPFIGPVIEYTGWLEKQIHLSAPA